MSLLRHIHRRQLSSWYHSGLGKWVALCVRVLQTSQIIYAVGLEEFCKAKTSGCGLRMASGRKLRISILG